jgi:hypothetical protein
MMPFYIYKDEKTGEKVEIMMSMSEMLRRQRPDKTIVHDDGRVLIRDVVSEHRGTSHSSGTWPLLSDAAGVHPNQVNEAMEHASRNGVPTRFHPETGQAIFESRGHRKAFLRMRGMYDKSGGYGD